MVTDGEDRLSYDDRAVTAGTSYSYRLSYLDGGVEVHSAETTVLVPRRYELALAGFRPNPALSNELAIAFTLPSEGSGQLELLDVTGRRVSGRDLSGLAPGPHTLRLSDGAHVPAGVYWVRLTHAGRMLTARGVVIR